MRLPNGPIGGDDESAHGSAAAGIKRVISTGYADLQLAEQQQDEENDQNHATQPHAGMAHAVPVTAEPPGKAAEQEDNQDDDKYRSKRHGTLPRRRPARGYYAATGGNQGDSGTFPSPLVGEGGR